VLAASIITDSPPLMMEAASISESLVNFYQTTLFNNPEDSNLYTRRRENLKSHYKILIFNNLKMSFLAPPHIVFSSEILCLNP
jgi:hypothetical protein